jgi:hypothetical protein
MPDIQPREPIVFAIGDSLYFSRWLPEFLPANGYYLHYELLSATGQVQVGFNSTPQGNLHLIQIDNFANGLDPEQYYILAGYAINPNGQGGGQERHQIYRGGLQLTPNLADGVGVDDQTPYEEQQVKKLRCIVDKLNNSYLKETDIARVRIIREEREKMRTELCFWEERLQFRKNQEIARNGGPSQSIVRPVFQIL